MSLSLSQNLVRIRVRRSFSTTAIRFSTSINGDVKKEEKHLFGTIPSHRSYIFLHGTGPPSSFPARVSNPLQRALQLKVTKWGGIVNFSWFGGSKPPSTSDRASATAFSIPGGRLEIPEITLENLDDIEERLRKHAEGPLEKKTADEVHLYVCTHGARDCRCGDLGGAVVRALNEEIARLKEADPTGLVSRVKVGEVGHVGGHQHAANLLIYPHGEWLGMLKPEDVPVVLSSILDSFVGPFDSERKPMLPSHWRGRMGLSKEEQTQLFISNSSI